MPKQHNSSKKNITSREFRIFPMHDLMELHAIFSSRDDWQSISAVLNEAKFTVKDGDVSYRVINHWADQGLFDDTRAENSKNWRKLTFLDLLWLRVLRELRSFGMPLDKLRNAYEAIFFINGKSAPFQFETAAALCMSNQPTSVFIVVFNDGHAEIATEQCLKLSDKITGSTQPYIKIHLNSLCCEIFGNNRFMPDKENTVELGRTETEALEIFRNSENNEVLIRFKNGEMDSIETTKLVQGTQSIAEVMHDTNFGEILIKVENGKPAYTRTTKKKKAKK